MRTFLKCLVAVCVFCAASAFALGEVDTYKLGAGDKIQILVYDEEDLSLDALLGESGILNYPFLGELSLSGLSVAEVEQLITKGLLGDYLIKPKVSVSVIVFISGEVEKPGGFEFQPGLTVGKAISLAGGFTERADKKDIYIVSDNAGTAKPRKVRIGAPVKPGDIITIEQSFF